MTTFSTLAYKNARFCLNISNGKHDLFLGFLDNDSDFWTGYEAAYCSPVPDYLYQNVEEMKWKGKLFLKSSGRSAAFSFNDILNARDVEIGSKMFTFL